MDNPEHQLLTLRSHLLALSRTEGQLKDLREKATESTTTTETSIVEVLTLWQTIFQQTFHEYHRLSTRLVQSQDSSAALRLWQEYLHHVQSFLSNEIPEDYASLSEHRHLCEVHQNLLTSQQSVLALNDTSIKAKIDPAVWEQFNSLTGLHNETLSRIIDRSNEIQMRLTAWDQYRNDQAQLLEWLREKEKERNRLQLRYIHLKRVPTIVQRVERLLEQIPQGESDAIKLRQLQPQFLQSCEDAFVTSVRMEHASITQRIANLRAALETWRDFLTKITQLHQSYEIKVQHIQNNVQEVQSILASTAKHMPGSSADVQDTLVRLRAQRVRLGNLTSELEAINVIQEELKECVSPFDMKTIRQMVWILWQQQADLDQQLASLINQIDERVLLNAHFNQKHDRMMKWMDGIETRVNSDSSSNNLYLRDPEQLINSLEKELQSEIALHRRDREWLLSSGNELLSFYAGATDADKQQRLSVQTNLDILNERWERIQLVSTSRSNKLRDLRQTIVRLEERIALIRVWLYQMEVDLGTPVVFRTIDTSVVNEILADHDKLQRSIEQQSSEVGEVLNLSEMLLSDVDTWKSHFNTTALTTAVEQLERRWKNVCSLSAERKRHILSNWTLLQEVTKLTAEHEKW